MKSEPLIVAKDTKVEFLAIKTPTAAPSWPAGKPVWSGASGSGGQASNTFSTAGTNYVYAECGNTVTGVIFVITNYTIIPSCRYLALSNTVTATAWTVDAGGAAVKTNSDWTIAEGTNRMEFAGSTAGVDTVTLVGIAASSVTNDVRVHAHASGNTNLCDDEWFTVIKVDIDVDSDRNGTVDGTDAEDAVETNTPAIMIVNNDDDDGKQKPKVDCSDNIVNGSEDMADLAELVIQSIPTLPTGWKAILSVSSSDAEHVRVFDGKATNATARIGPAGFGLSSEYEIPDVSSNLTYGIEATNYASSTYSGTTTVSLIVKRADNSEFARDEVKLKVAPFILLPSTRPAEKIYVLDKDANFVAQLKTAVGASKVMEVSSILYNDDVWVQDEVEIGCIQRPVNTTMPAVWNLPRLDENGNSRPLDAWPSSDLRGTNFGYFVEGTGGNNADYGGNMECTPPVTVGGTEYKFGRAMVSTTMNSSLTQFIETQGIQTPILKLNVDWLLVGHVDEVVAFVPSGSGFKILIADTDCAIDLLKNLNTEDTGTASGGSLNLLTDAVKSWTSNTWQDGFISITAGTGSGQVRQIASNTATSVVPKGAWTTPPDTNSQYEVVARSAYRCLFFEGTNEDLGVASAATSTTLTDISKNWTASTWAGGFVRIVAGTGTGQIIEISGNTSTQLMLSASWTTTPDDTSQYIIVQKSKKWLQWTGWFYVESPAVTTVREVLSKTDFTNFNHTCQANIDNIRSALTNELGLSDPDFVKIPTIFEDKTKAVAYVPDMVNLLVDGTTLVLAKPFGPRNNGADVFENDATNKLSGYSIHFIDDWDWYHRKEGEVHCGTNAKRTPPTVKWWE